MGFRSDIEAWGKNLPRKKPSSKGKSSTKTSGTGKTPSKDPSKNNAKAPSSSSPPKSPNSLSPKSSKSSPSTKTSSKIVQAAGNPTNQTIVIVALMTLLVISLYFGFICGCFRRHPAPGTTRRRPQRQTRC
ncbi:hypothetical protein JYU34_011361 [Plutella xylostella]|uniref:Uncharacterized protein n=1 Tax=Plutella xylostella TaxID=51655 RepID=A0ABQ7QGV6_PLUXY|nr:hypothetical protein JYU34_011361 [Plutella xylostella]